jgi:hypothetical protein
VRLPGPVGLEVEANPLAGGSSEWEYESVSRLMVFRASLELLLAVISTTPCRRRCRRTSQSSGKRFHSTPPSLSLFCTFSSHYS